MSAFQEFPFFDSCFHNLNQFILELVEACNAGKIRSWNELEEKVRTFFAPEMMMHMEFAVPGWGKMASYSGGITLTHVMCVFMGLFMMPEFLGMTQEQQGLMKWIVLFHDIEKEVQNGKRDHIHGFRSAIATARILPKLGFPVTFKYDSLIDEWSEFTCSAMIKPENSLNYIQDNRKLPMILDGIERMFGHGTPAALIIKTILFHLSISMNDWPPAAPLTNDEIKNYFDSDLTPLAKVMNLGDNDGWSIFEPSIRERQRIDTIEVFEKVEQMITG